MTPKARQHNVSMHRGSDDEGIPNNLIQRQSHLNQARVVQGYIQRHIEPNSNDSFPLLLERSFMLPAHFFAQHKRQQCNEAEHHVAACEQQRKREAVRSEKVLVT